MEGIRAAFIKSVKSGRIPSSSDLVKLAKKRGVTLTEKQITALKASWLPTAIRRHYVKPKKFQRGFTVPRLGTIQIGLVQKDKVACLWLTPLLISQQTLPSFERTGK